MKKPLLFMLSLLIIGLFMSGCQEQNSNEESSKLKIESGVTDSKYNGIVNPQLEVQFKMTEEEQKNGVKKLEMEGEEVEIEEPGQEEGEKDEDGGKRPNI